MKPVVGELFSRLFDFFNLSLKANFPATFPVGENFRLKTNNPAHRDIISSLSFTVDGHKIEIRFPYHYFPFKNNWCSVCTRNVDPSLCDVDLRGAGGWDLNKKEKGKYRLVSTFHSFKDSDRNNFECFCFYLT